MFQNLPMIAEEQFSLSMDSRQQQQQPQQQQQQRNSKHANTSSSVAQAAATTSAAMMATATQMRATLIYLAPFLHPCKNVVPGTSAATTTQQHLSADWDGAEDVEVLQKTHVARVSATPTTGTASLSSSTAGSRSSMTRRGDGVVGAHSNSNRNVTTTSCAGTNTLLHPGGHNNHYYNAINCNSTVINASTGVRHASGGNGKGNSNSNDISSSSIRSSCCHHNNAATERQDLDDTTAKLQWPDASEQPKIPKKKKDNAKCYENYEKMPALETTTTTKPTTTTTMFASANNKIRQQQTEQSNDQGCLVARVVESPQKPADNPSLSATTSINSCRSNTTLTSSGMSGGMVPSTKSSLAIQQDTKTTTSFVNYPNSRSTKYIRERGRRHHHQQQQQGHTSTLALAPVGRQPLKKLEEFQLEQRRKSPCGRYSHPDLCSNATTTTAPASAMAVAVIDNHNTAKCCNNNQMANTSLLSRCHDSNKTLSNVPASQDHNNNVQDEVEEDGHHDLILRHSLEGSGNAIGNEIFYTHNENVLLTPAPSVSSSSSSSTSSSSSASASISTSTPTSYTTILNKECRCFNKTKRDIIIGSERHSKNPAMAPTTTTTTAVATTATPLPASSFQSCCIINSNADSSSNALSRQQPVLDLSATTSSTVSSTSMEESSSLSTASSLLATAASLFWWRCWCWLVALFGCSKLTKTVTVSKWLFMWLLFVVLSSPAQCWAGRNDVPTNCTFPARWEGSWFLSGYQQSIHIKGSQFSYRGRCAASDGNKYLIVDEKGCHRCLVIYEKHKNVLQYKESECEGDSMYMHQTNPSAMAMRSVLNQKPSLGNGGDHRGGAHPNLNGHSRLSSSDQYIMRSNDDMNDCPPDFCKGRETLQNLCDQIPGDALLYSLFRESAEPVKCPLKGPFVFTYNRGNGECKSPVSNIESCTEDSRLLLSFQACPDVVGTESTVEELTCLATWKDGNSRYLVGLVSHHHAISNEERYRCFVYEKISSLMDMGHFGGPSMSTSKDAEYKLAQSGDATCNGLDSAEVGSRIMSLRKPPVTERCDFPAWFKGPRHWHVLMGNAVYNYHSNDGSIHIIKPNGYMDTRALCEQINKQTATEMMSVVHYTTGCQSGFMCMMFYRRDTHIIEIQTGKPASRLEDACAPDHFDINKTPYITLLASNPDPQICPMEGLYTLRGAIGPPYMTTRHKRNHNNKVHGIHNHHHQFESNERGLHRRHTSLSFRNSNPNERNAWHSNTRGLPGRSRRDASSTTTQPTTSTLNGSQELSASSASALPKDVTTQEILVVGNSTNVGFVQDPDSDNRLRSRRNVPECITNYKAQRQLWIGCTEPNVIDVRPLCNDEGDEEYSCHGSWSENGTVYIIARHKGTKHGVCISYRPTEGTNAKLVVGDACYRGTQKPPEHHLEASLSVFGKCGETGNTSATIPILSWIHLMTASILTTILCQFAIPR